MGVVAVALQGVVVPAHIQNKSGYPDPKATVFVIVTLHTLTPGAKGILFAVA